ncbi:uncharacterized protein V6R79_006232 [Siganus canaliculatus]
MHWKKDEPFVVCFSDKDRSDFSAADVLIAPRMNTSPAVTYYCRLSLNPVRCLLSAVLEPVTSSIRVQKKDCSVHGTSTHHRTDEHKFSKRERERKKQSRNAVTADMKIRRKGMETHSEMHEAPDQGTHAVK